MGRAWWVVLATSGCGSVFGLGDPQPLPLDAPGASCIVAGFDLCAHQQPNGPIHFEVDTTINTTLDCNVVLFNPTGGSVCVIYASDLTVTSTVRATGARPLVLAATGDITIDGTLDVSSSMAGGTGAAANDPTCAVKRVNGSTSGGGAGGSFRGKGGDGGAGTVSVGTAGLAGDSVALPAVLRGGCPGYAALGGVSPGGGAVRVVASTSLNVTATGRVLANGAGGQPAGQLFGGYGGVGGASGGMIQLAAPSIAIQGVLSANGGGGSEAGDMTSGGASGSDGGPNSTPAKGGAGMSPTGGDGGAGGAGTTLMGVNGASTVAATSGGGGGGGGVGYIVITAATVDTTGSTISPAALMNE
jgi:hypothetical protein